MPEEETWSFPEAVQPAADELEFDLPRALDAMVSLRANVPDDAFTAGILGTERSGYGAVIHPGGLVVTIGYLITEAESIWLTTNRGDVVEGWPILYDQRTGFGLIQPLGPLDATSLERGSVANVEVDDLVTVIGHGGRAHAIRTRIIEKREFAGYWEYVLDEALFTSPAHPQWSGAALLDAKGRLIGIGSLLVQAEADGEETHANMFVPIDLLDPLLDRLANPSRGVEPPRPWLGMYTQEADGNLVVVGTAPAPGARADVALVVRVAPYTTGGATTREASVGVAVADPALAQAIAAAVAAAIRDAGRDREPADRAARTVRLRSRKRCSL
jgi:S1-C subfamily serine protease